MERKEKIKIATPKWIRAISKKWVPPLKWHHLYEQLYESLEPHHIMHQSKYIVDIDRERNFSF